MNEYNEYPDGQNNEEEFLKIVKASQEAMGELLGKAVQSISNLTYATNMIGALLLAEKTFTPAQIEALRKRYITFWSLMDRRNPDETIAQVDEQKREREIRENLSF